MRILDLTRLLPGPLAARMLADMGHEVVRVEPPQGDLLALAAPEAYAWLNAGKQTLTLDLKDPAGQAALRELVAGADALIETNRPGVMERLGVGPEALRAINQGLVYVRLAGYRDPAWRDAPGHDLAYLAADGLLPRLEPAWRHTQLADTAGAYWAVIAVLDGSARGGGFAEVFLSEAARVAAYPALPALDGSVLCYGLYAAADGQIALTALEPHLWARCCEALGHPEWTSEAFSPAGADNPIWEALAALFRAQPQAAWEAWAREQGLPLRAVKPPRLPETTAPWQWHDDQTRP